MKEEAEFLAKVEDDEKKRLEKELLHQIEQNARHREELQRQEQEERQKARRRAYSDVTERPSVESTIESFDEDVEVSGIKFDSVRLYHGRKGIASILGVSGRCVSTLYREPWIDL